jgi:thiol-disulfide isomerase/thioredoxin
MTLSRIAAIAVLMFAGLATGQTPSAANAETKELTDALSEGGSSSSVDLARTLEQFLKKYPQTAQRKQIERALAHAAIENKDDRRTILYGQRMLLDTPDDMLVLDRVARALLALGGRENAEKSLQYSRAFEQFVRKAPAPEGGDAGRKQEERERGLSRALLYQFRAKAVLEEKAEAERLAAEAYQTFPCEESAREWSTALVNSGKDADALQRIADAFVIPDSRAVDTDRAEDRRKLGDLYHKLHHDDKGLGDLILTAYDRTAALIAEHHSRLLAFDPNMGATDPMQFTLTGLDGKKLPLKSLKGSVVVFDFWATWCAPCRAQHPLYEQVKERFKDRRDVVFIAVATDEDRLLVSPYLDKQNWNKVVYFDDGLQRLLQVTAIPTTVLFDKQGRVASRMNGFLPEKFVDQLSERIQYALSDSQ